MKFDGKNFKQKKIMKRLIKKTGLKNDKIL